MRTAIRRARQMKLLGLVVAAVGVVITFRLWIADPEIFGRTLSFNNYREIVPMILLPLFLGGAIYAIEWLIEGFIQPIAKRQ